MASVANGDPDNQWKKAVERAIVYQNENLSPNIAEIIEHYRGDTDPDDWGSAPLRLSYQIINWATKKVTKNVNKTRPFTRSFTRSTVRTNRVPALLSEEGLKESGLTFKDLHEQVENAKKLDAALSNFPTLGKNESVKVYRGEGCHSFYNEKVQKMTPGQIIEITSFLSTSINKYVARRFTKMNAVKCLWEIIIPPGQIFPYVSQDVPNQVNMESAAHSEQEVLLPVRALLKLVKRGEIVNSDMVYTFHLVGFGIGNDNKFWKKVDENIMKEASDAGLNENRNGNENENRNENENEERPQGKIPKRNPAYGGSRKTRKRTKHNRKSRKSSHKN
jgi:hypothetical protein